MCSCEFATRVRALTGVLASQLTQLRTTQNYLTYTQGCAPPLAAMRAMHVHITYACVDVCVSNNHAPYPQRYDADGSGSIDANELESLLKDLDFNIRNKGTVK